jgi:uncharacterized protein YcbK (DUF882 family)
MKLTEHFNREEFECTDGSEMPIEVQLNIAELAVQLEIIRSHFNAPIHINSAYRSPEYNATIPGSSKNSQHILGKAADIVVEGFTPDEVADAIEFLISTGMVKEGGLGRYNSFTHYDIRGTRARWNYKTI